MIRFIQMLSQLTYWTAQLAIISTLFVVTGEVISRYVFNSPTQTSLEITEYLIVTVGFLPLAMIHKVGGHVSVDLVLEVMTPRWKKLCHMISTIITSTFSFLVFSFGLLITLHAFNAGTNSSSLMAFPMWIAYLPIPLGFFALGCQSLLDLFDSNKQGANI